MLCGDVNHGHRYLITAQFDYLGKRNRHIYIHICCCSPNDFGPSRTSHLTTKSFTTLRLLLFVYLYKITRAGFFYPSSPASDICYFVCCLGYPHQAAVLFHRPDIVVTKDTRICLLIPIGRTTAPHTYYSVVTYISFNTL